MLLFNFFSAYHIIHACYEKSKLLNQSLNFFCGNEYFKCVIHGKVYMKLSVKAWEENYLKAKKGTLSLSFNCVKPSVGVPFCYRLSWERIRRVISLTIYDFRQVHLESVRNIMLSQVKTFDRHYYWNFVFHQSRYDIEICFPGYLQPTLLFSELTIFLLTVHVLSTVKF